MRRDVVARRPKRHVLLPEGFLRLGLSLSCVLYGRCERLKQGVGTVRSIRLARGGVLVYERTHVDASANHAARKREWESDVAGGHRALRMYLFQLDTHFVRNVVTGIAEYSRSSRFYREKVVQ